MTFAAIAPLIALGALGGGVSSGFGSQNEGGNFFTGSPGRFEQISNLLPQQQQNLMSLLDQLGIPQEQGLEYISQILSGDEGAFRDFEAPFQRQFEQETVPGIAERFAGLGSHGSMSSSGLNQSLAQGGRELSENLASLRGNLKQNALSQLQGLIGQGMRPTFENVYRQPTMGAFGGLASGVGQGAGQLGGLAMLKQIGAF